LGLGSPPTTHGGKITSAVKNEEKLLPSGHIKKEQSVENQMGTKRVKFSHIASSAAVEERQHIQ